MIATLMLSSAVLMLCASRCHGGLWIFVSFLLDRLKTAGSCMKNAPIRRMF
jgi:hypothetical protein